MIKNILLLFRSPSLSFRTREKIFCFSFALLLSYQLAAQKSRVDSLENLLGYDQADQKRVDVLNHLAYEYAFSKPKKAGNYAQRAIDLAEKLDYHKGKAEGLKNLGAVCTIQSNYKSALDYFLQSLKEYESLKDYKGKAKLLNNIGFVYKNLKDYDKALEYNLKSISIKEKIKDKLGIAYSYSNIGEIYTEQKEYSKARIYFKNALKILNELGHQKLRANLLSGLGEVYTKTGAHKEALDFFSESLAIDREMLNKDGMAQTFNKLGWTYLKLKKIKEAEMYAKEALLFSKEIGAKQSELESYHLLSEIKEIQKNTTESLKFYKQYTSLKDSLFTTEKSAQIADMQTRYDTEKKMKENELLQKREIINQERLNNQKILFRVSVVILLLVLIFAVIFYRANTQKKKINLILEEQKQIIQLKNIELEKQKEEIEAQRDTLADINSKVTDSIRYAKTIQEAMLPFEDKISQYLSEYFILFKPRDIVSGDFYWFENIDDKIVIAAVDCTGHGVPGAFMSMIGYELLHEIINEKKVLEADKILSYLHKGIRHALKQDQKRNDDGMDLALCIIDKKQKTLEFAGARNPLWIIQGNELIEVQGDNKSLAGYQKREEGFFKKHNLSIDPQPYGDTTFYLVTDGYQDQLGGNEERKRKFKKHRLRELLLEIHQKPMSEQQQILQDMLEEWKGDFRQVDDILIVGVRLDEAFFQNDIAQETPIYLEI